MMNIAIVGIGIVGGSFAMGLEENENYNVMGIDISEDTINKALKSGIISEGSTSSKDILEKADLTVICIYPDALVSFVEDNKNYFKKGSVVMDVTGIKTGIIESLTPHIPEDVDFIFSHPMAGREKKGIDYASKEVNIGANFLITPTPLNKEENLNLIEKVAKDVGFGKISRVSPEHHDKMIAFTSQLPHAMAVALVNSDEQFEETGKFIGDSYRDLTRIAEINEDLWAELFLGNKNYLLHMINSFEGELDKIKDAINKDDDEELKELFRKSTMRREQL